MKRLATLTKTVGTMALLLGIATMASAAIGGPVYKVVVQAGSITKIVDPTGTVTPVNATLLEVPAGTTVYIKSNAAPTGLTFDAWYSTTSLNFRVYTASSSFIMPAEDVQVIDVREPDEYAQVNIDGLLIPLNTVAERAGEISKDKKVVIHCKLGGRSAKAIRELEEKFGFKNLYNLKGGITAYLEHEQLNQLTPQPDLS